MMTNSPSAMPGAFNFHRNGRDTTPQPPRLSTGAKSHIFQPPAPPRTPSASSSVIMTRSTASMVSISSAGQSLNKFGAKKRTLDDYNNSAYRGGGGGMETPRSYVDLGDEGMSVMGMGDGWMPGSPRPFVNTRYEVKGGLDTPGRMMAEQGESEYSGVGYRKNLNEDVAQGDGGYFEFGHGMGNGWGDFDDGYKASPGGEAWKTAIQMVGGVVGKVWNFCSGAVFKGFQAGGGTRYQMNPSTNTSESTFVALTTDASDFWETEKYGEAREATPLPRRFPEEDFIPDYIDHPDRPTPSPPRPAKRRQISNNNVIDEYGGIAKNWVVVPPTVTTASAPALRTHKSQPIIRGPARYSMATASSTSRRSIVPRAAAVTPRPASRASNPMVKRQALSRVSHAGSPSLNTNQGASFASPRSPASVAGSRLPRPLPSPARNALSNFASASTPPGTESPAAKEARRWAALKRKEEREADESLSRLEKQLRDMIREGKEALGTKVSVEMEDDLDFDDHRPSTNTNTPSKKWKF